MRSISSPAANSNEIRKLEITVTRIYHFSEIAIVKYWMVYFWCRVCNFSRVRSTWRIHYLWTFGVRGEEVRWLWWWWRCCVQYITCAIVFIFNRPTLTVWNHICILCRWLMWMSVLCGIEQSRTRSLGGKLIAIELSNLSFKCFKVRYQMNIRRRWTIYFNFEFSL